MAPKRTNYQCPEAGLWAVTTDASGKEVSVFIVGATEYKYRVECAKGHRYQDFFAEYSCRTRFNVPKKACVLCGTEEDFLKHDASRPVPVLVAKISGSFVNPITISDDRQVPTAVCVDAEVNSEESDNEFDDLMDEFDAMMSEGGEDE